MATIGRSAGRAPSATVRIPARTDLDVRVSGGIVRGVRDGSTLAWRGIHYAAPPVGELRFRGPAKVIPWTGVRDASRYGQVAPQLHYGQFRGASPKIPAGEDCLTINVLAPAERSLPLPVMVFIHGGGYSAGSSQDFPGQGESFVGSGRVVYVSFNYRLGALGWLHFGKYSTPERPIENNLGLRDQVAAFEWVRDNIAAFGGDPGNVTIFGESAGGNSVTTLMATPSARGLFARAIAQSPPANAVYSRELADGWAEAFVDILRSRAAVGKSSNPPASLITSATVAQLTRAALTLQIGSPDLNPGTFCLAPVVDGGFLPQHPIAAFRSGDVARVPLIIGTNDREGSLFRGRIDILPRTPTRIRALIRHAPPGSRPAMRAAYPGLPAARPAADFAGDYAFWYPSALVADRHSRSAPVHVYRFDIAPRLVRLLGLDATHGIELLTLFDRADTPLVKTMTVLGGREQFTSAGDRMRLRWIQFATDGTVAEDWPPYLEDDRATLIIDQVDRVEADPRGERRRAWAAFLPAV